MNKITACRELAYTKYLSYLTRQLNFIHGVSEGSEYWSLIIGPWLMEYINQTEFIFRTGEPNLNSSSSSIDYVVPFDYTSFVLLRNELDFNIHLKRCYSRKKKNISASSWMMVYRPSRQVWYKRFLIIFLEFLLRKFIKNKVILVDSMISSSNYILIFFKSKFKFISFPVALHAPTKNANLCRSTRLWKISVASNNDYEAALNENILNHIPYVYVEGFKLLKLSVKGILPMKLVSATGMYGNERLKVVAAEIKKRKGVLIGLQHGGGPYGVSNTNIIDIEINNVDKYLTWGWETQSNTKAFYSFRTSQFIDSVKKTTNTLSIKYLYVGTSCSKFQFDGFPQPSGVEFEDDYIAWQHRFFLKLSKSIRKKIVYRGYPYDKEYGWNQVKGIKNLNIGIRMDAEVRYSKSISGASLVVCDNLYTTFFESLSIDKPTILFFNDSCWRVNEEFEILLLEMEEVGIFHRTPESAASMIESIDANINEWWGSDKMVLIKNKIILKYARSQLNIVELFINEVSK